MGRKRQFAEQGTGLCPAIVMPTRTPHPTLWMKDRFQKKQPIAAPMVERPELAAADTVSQNSNGSRQSGAVVHPVAMNDSTWPAGNVRARGKRTTVPARPAVIDRVRLRATQRLNSGLLFSADRQRVLKWIAVCPLGGY